MTHKTWPKSGMRGIRDESILIPVEAVLSTTAIFDVIQSSQ